MTNDEVEEIWREAMKSAIRSIFLRKNIEAASGIIESEKPWKAYVTVTDSIWKPQSLRGGWGVLSK